MIKNKSTLGYEHMRGLFEEAAEDMGLCTERRPDRRRTLYASNATKFAWAVWCRAYRAIKPPSVPVEPPVWDGNGCMFCEFRGTDELEMRNHLNSAHNPPLVDDAGFMKVRTGGEPR